MRPAIFRDLVILLSIFTGIWLFFKYVDVFPDENYTISIEDEEKLGDLLMDNVVLAEGGEEVVSNRAVDSMMLIINRRVKDEIGLTDYDYTILVVKSEEINAFTLPGGNILIYSGLIEFAKNPEELAAVLAHEIGHVEKRHVVNKLLKEFTIEIIFSVLSGGDLSLLGELLQSTAATIYDRKQEKEADDYSMNLLTRSNISPRYIASFFRRLSREKGTYNENLEFMMTHPHNNSRIKASLEFEIPEDFHESPIAVDWEFFQKSVNQLSQNE